MYWLTNTFSTLLTMAYTLFMLCTPEWEKMHLKNSFVNEKFRKEEKLFVCDNVRIIFE